MGGVSLLLDGRSLATARWEEFGYCSMGGVRLLLDGRSLATARWEEFGSWKEFG